ncbi:MAG: sigma 54-interacting transcriptional regulator [Alphaproteobacteria bacterium]|nr:sigma 54-interacting transcriptional regulator [Alphaproteobacteria bacterium]
MTVQARSLAELRYLETVAAWVGQGTELDELLGPVLRGLAEQLGLRRATLMLVDRTDGEVYIEAGHGLTPTETRRVRYAPGEGISGRVVASGEPVLVPRVSEDPSFRDKLGAREGGLDGAFVAVPVMTSATTYGVLSAWRLGEEDPDLEGDRSTLSVVAGLLVPPVERHVSRTGKPGEDRAPHQPSNLIGRSKGMKEVYALIEQVAPSSTTVLLRGESGTGKELVAHALHEGSPRARGPFVKVNCAALPAAIIESELFGHERGSFTGAIDRRRGRFELAHGGTIFLDEIGDLAPETQIKLLRVLQEREFERVGSAQPIGVDVRVIAATSRDLEIMMEDGGFRPDLYYRLNVFPVHLPPLRERRADILLLADHFVEQFSRSHGKSVRRIATAAIDLLMAYHWPGNVRELENCMERAVLLARGDTLMAHHLPPTLQAPDHLSSVAPGGLESTLAAVEKDLILDALKANRGNMAGAARQLQVTERVMGLRVKLYGIDPRRFRGRLSA